VVIVDWKDTEVPIKPNVEIKLSAIDKEKLCRIQTMFDERPIWSFVALKSSVSIEDVSSLKGLLPLVAYYFNNGPWRRVWVRMGYDPRKDPQSRIYQVIDLRVLPSQLLIGKPGGVSNIAHKSAFAKAPRRIKRPVAGAPFAEIQESGHIELGCDDGEIEIDASRAYSYKNGYTNVDDYSFSVPPCHQQTIYQLCDVSEKNVQKLLQAAKPKDSCNEKIGWFTQQHMKKIRAYMKTKLKVMLEGGSTDAIEEVEGNGDGDRDDSEAEDLDNDDIEQVGQNVGYLQTLMQSMESPPLQTSEVNYADDEFLPYTIFGEDDDEDEDYEYEALVSTSGSKYSASSTYELDKDDEEQFFT